MLGATHLWNFPAVSGMLFLLWCGHEPSGLQFRFKLSWLPGLNPYVLGGVVFDKPGKWQSHGGPCS